MLCVQDKQIYVWYAHINKTETPAYSFCETEEELIHMDQEVQTNEFALAFAIRGSECVQHFTLQLFHFHNLKCKLFCFECLK